MKRQKEKARICVSIAKKNTQEVLKAVGKIESSADVIEVRLDCLEKIELSVLTSKIRKPLLFTNRPTWEGGRYSGNEKTRIDPLQTAIWLEYDYVDLELQAPPESLNRLLHAREKSSTQLILSSHDFDKTPSLQQLLDTVNKMVDKGADVGKIVTMARNYHDVLKVLQLQEEALKYDFPLIAFCMGRQGVISRLATLELGGYMTYCSVDENEATAPGQLSLQTLRDIYKLMISNEH